MKTAYFYDPDCSLHEMGASHPESPDRIRVIHQALSDAKLFDSSLEQIEIEPAKKSDLVLAHTLNHVSRIFDSAPADGSIQLDPDTSMNPHSLRAALLAAGSVIQAVDAVVSGNYYNAFCNVRPPGHHAEQHRPMGFCIFNNIAVGIHHALKQATINRIALIDFDVHHGNGTEDIFREDERVLLCQTFQSPFYPFTGEAQEEAHIVNRPLRAGASGEDFRYQCETFCFPEIDAFKPDMIFISAGFDAHKNDPLAQCELQEDDYAWVTAKINELAHLHCTGKIVSSLEGGYHLQALANSATSHVKALVQAK